MKDTQAFLIANVESAIKDAIEREKEEVIDDAVHDFEKRLRNVVGRVAINLVNHYSVERMGPELVIRVRIGDGQ